jgi:hypothetical protein
LSPLCDIVLSELRGARMASNQTKVIVVPSVLAGVGGHYRKIYTTNISPKRRKIHINTHIYICF